MDSRKYITIDYLNEYFIKKPIIEYPNNIDNNYSNIKISVIVLAYNHQDYIAATLEGILSQSVNFEYEILLNEDESSDDTRKICKEYATKYSSKIRLFLHKRENNIKILGKPCGILPYVYALLHSNAKYIAVCGGDDYWTDPNKLQAQYDHLVAQPECSLVFQRWQEKYINNDGSIMVGDTKKSFPKASTAMFINFKEKMPVEMLNVIQEDSFGWYILKQYGNFDCLDTLKPVVVNTPVESLTRSLSNLDFFKQTLNLKKNIYYAYKNTPTRIEAKNQYVEILLIVLNSTRLSALRNKCIYISISSLLNDKLLFYAILRTAQIVLKEKIIKIIKHN